MQFLKATRTKDGSTIESISYDEKLNIYKGSIYWRDHKGAFQSQSLTWTASGRTKDPNKCLVLHESVR